MTGPLRLDLPVSRTTLAGLDAGDEVLLSGPVFTARDATHERLLAELAREGGLPYGLEGATLFYAGPTPPAAGRPAGAVGPTTARRMDAATPDLLRAGIVATIGKGKRGDAVREACAATGSVYFAAVGGAAALLARHVTESELVAWPDLGTEALVRLTLRDFPVFVAIDTRGRDLYAEAPAQWRREAGGDGMIAGGVFITFEGGEGSGKSTQLARLAEHLRAEGFDVVVTREPGGTPVGDRIREVLLDTAHAGMAPMAELLLYEASRAELVAKVIEPALARGAVVLCDRFADSSTAYQSFARGLPLDDVLALNELATAGRTPDLTLIFDVDPSIGLARANATGAADRLESEALAFHQSVRAAFLTLADRDPARFAVIDASADEATVATQVSTIVGTALNR